MKRFVTIMIVLLCFVSAITVYADFINPTITDSVGYLTEEQNKELSARLDKIREQYNFDIVFVSEDRISAYDAQAAADDIYDYNGYGYGENYDGILFYIADYERKYHFSVCGSGETIFNENGLAYLEKKVVPFLKEDNYYAAVKSYAEHTEELLEMAAGNKQKIELIVIPTSYDKLVIIQNGLQAIRGVKNVNLVNYANGRGTFTMQFGGAPQVLFAQLQENVDCNIRLDSSAYNVLTIAAW